MHRKIIIKHFITLWMLIPNFNIRLTNKSLTNIYINNIYIIILFNYEYYECMIHNNACGMSYKKNIRIIQEHHL